LRRGGTLPISPIPALGRTIRSTDGDLPPKNQGSSGAGADYERCEVN